MGSAIPPFQLRAESRGKAESPPAPAVGERAFTLSATRYVHGEMKFSIYPTPAPRKVKRFQGVALCGAMEPGRMTNKQCVEARQQRAARPGFLDSSSEFQDRSKEISGWGTLPRQKKFSRYGRQVINEAGEIAWRKHGKNGIFLTGTVPGSGDVIASTVAAYSGWLMNRVKQWFRDLFSADYSVFAVWELQTRGMLHIHICVTGTQTEILERLCQTWRKRWNGLLLELSELTGVDLFRKNERVTWKNQLQYTQQDAQWLRHNPAQYLSKYLSKSSRQTASGGVFHPSRWWSVDRKTAAEARAERVRVISGGLPLATLAAVVEGWFRKSREFFDKTFVFQNPHVEGAGGVVAFTESENSLGLIGWFEIHAEQLLKPIF